ncbi:hypothetical protein XENOCAPTIV_021026 [Xenoophorus captivus]|uniref:UEV domain-containing protein n=1 Tax=Xenoophorus captivus TaxID=1517983 RepID=A0ABV0SH76_9TELE
MIRRRLYPPFEADMILESFTISDKSDGTGKPGPLSSAKPGSCVSTGSQYNVPVCIWLHETHPASRPRCFVCPSVSMVINLSCPYVDSSGTITLDGLKNWTPVRFAVHALLPGKLFIKLTAL